MAGRRPVFRSRHWRRRAGAVGGSCPFLRAPPRCLLPHRRVHCPRLYGGGSGGNEARDASRARPLRESADGAPRKNGSRWLPPPPALSCVACVRGVANTRRSGGRERERGERASVFFFFGPPPHRGRALPPRPRAHTLTCLFLFSPSSSSTACASSAPRSRPTCRCCRPRPSPPRTCSRCAAGLSARLR